MPNLHPHWFWERVDMSGGADACWPWTGSIRSVESAYGRFWHQGKCVSAHRFALLLSKGPTSRDKDNACHTCDNPRCCNPAHLWWGTSQENCLDAVRKGRKRLTCREQIVTTDKLISLRRQGLSYSQIAKEFSVNQSSVARALAKIGMNGPGNFGKGGALKARNPSHEG